MGQGTDKIRFNDGKNHYVVDCYPKMPPMAEDLDTLEESRKKLQSELDAGRSEAKRNKHGQFSTPFGLATDILQATKGFILESTPVRFMDPAFGTGVFYSALLRVFPRNCLVDTVGYEIDPYYGTPAQKLWHDTTLRLRIADFTQAVPPNNDRDKFNLMICNPPYVRHHHISGKEKHRLKNIVKVASGFEVSGLAGLHCYFINIGHAWMADNGVAAWLIPSGFKDVKYGVSVTRYLLEKTILLRVHEFNSRDVQFDDALVSSSVVWFKNAIAPADHKVRMTFGGSVANPDVEKTVRSADLWDNAISSRRSRRKTRGAPIASQLSDYFKIQRGLATGNNGFFILTERDIENRKLPMEAFRPILPGPRHITEEEIKADAQGDPLLERRLFLLDCRLSEGEIKEWSPALSSYLEEGKTLGVPDRYLCRHRIPWYSQEQRPAAPFLCTYIGRSDKNRPPFRFLLNHSRATAANAYLMLYPKKPINDALLKTPQLMKDVWVYLQAICPNVMIGKGRVYGGGLHKLEPRELGEVPAGNLWDVLRK